MLSCVPVRVRVRVRGTLAQMPFQVSVPPTATVEDVVQSVVRMHRRDDVSHTKPLPSYDSRCYELRLPDSDDPTLPDEDIPGLHHIAVGRVGVE